MKKEMKVVKSMKTIASTMTFAIVLLSSLMLTSCFISSNTNDNNNEGNENESVVIASFETSITIEQGQATVELINSSQNATSYEWSFPDGTPLSSTLENPTVTYAANGIYTITLDAFNDTTSASSVQDIEITNIQEPNPQPDPNDPTGCTLTTDCETVNLTGAPGGFSGTSEENANGGYTITVTDSTDAIVYQEDCYEGSSINIFCQN